MEALFYLNKRRCIYSQISVTLVTSAKVARKNSHKQNKQVLLISHRIFFSKRLSVYVYNYVYLYIQQGYEKNIFLNTTLAETTVLIIVRPTISDPEIGIETSNPVCLILFNYNETAYTQVYFQ